MINHNDLKMNKWGISLAALILLALILSTYSYLTTNSNSTICLLGSTCDTVKSSVYGNIFGISVSLFGVLSFVFFFFLFIFRNKHHHIKKSFFFATIIGTVFSLYFIYLQLFVLKAICTTCITIDGLMLIIFVLVFAYDEKHSS